ncbi:hypothetical protein JCM6882_000599 [Rhodosporidiobolus microsporus]
MATPSSAFPLSPTPQSPIFSADVTSTPPQPHPDERRNKRSSTASQGGRPDPNAASHYPSPPPPGSSSSSAHHRPRPAYDPSLVIPPYNPNKRRSAGGASGSSSSSSTTPSAPSRRNSSSAQQAFDERVANLIPSPPLPAQYQTTHAHAHAQRPVSTAAIPTIPAYHPSQQQAYYAQQQQQQQQQYAPAPTPQGPGGSVSSRSRQSVGYLPQQNSLAGQGPYPHLYNPHPMPRQKIYFGPYILLQTLGEGEFGKVKLGVHSERWGEDVAIKLIKRGNVDTAQRGEKVRREIEVLKMVRHPNIVRLYDVIETEKYIGIVLEYASGGELFDHILAHRYLKERDASRLFAQLISGVSYLHAKGVVHRDLKLENLLLDRNRNVIITDFGFANRFNDANVDLMATSCGSPCYAAPELVVQDGRYVGTAVDVWSCGVILYAMLAGYLPYDDDPANPEGDNINLLYKYILNTPLTFPEWITEEPRHLLLTMLVADPLKRCTIRDVTQHSWLRKYAHAFDKSVQELEYQAQEMEMHKRQALEIQRQWLIQQQQQQQLAAQGLLAPSMTRSQTATSSMGMAGVAPSTAAARHRSAMVTSTSTTAATAPLAQHGFEHYSMSVSQPPTPLPISEEQTMSPRSRTTSTASASSTSRRPPAAPPIVPIPHASNPNRRSGAYAVSASPPTTQTEFVAAEAGPFSFDSTRSSSRANSPQPSSVAMVPSLSAPAATGQPSPVPVAVAVSEDHIMADRSPSTSRANSTSRAPSVPAPASSAAEVDERERRRKAAHRATVQVEYDPSASQRRTRTKEAVPLPSPLAASPVVQGLAIHTEEPEASSPPPQPQAVRLEVPRVVETRESASPSPVPSIGGISVSTTTETMPGEDVVMQSVEEQEQEQEQEEPTVVVASPPLPPKEEQQDAPLPPAKEEVSTPAEEKALPQPQAAVEQPVATPAAGEPPIAPVARPATPPLSAAAIPFPAPATASPVPSSTPVPTSPTHINGTPRKRKSSSSPAPSLLPSSEPVPALPQPPSADLEATPRAKVSAASQASSSAQSAATEPLRAPSVASTTTSRHRHAPSADRFSIRTLLGGSLPANDRVSRPSSARIEGSTASSSMTGGRDALDEVTNRRKTRRQKALSLQPFRNSVSSKLPKQARANVEGQIGASRGRASTLSQQEQQQMAPPPVPTVRPQPQQQQQQQPAWVRPTATSTSSSSKRMSTDLEANWPGSSSASTHGHGTPTPSGKAKAVMDWFRRKSTRQDGLAPPPIQTDFDDRRRRAPSSTRAEAPASSNTSMRDGAITPTAPSSDVHPDRAPSVVITPVLAQGESQPSSRSASGAHSSQFSHKTVSTLATSVAAPSSSGPVATTVSAAPAAPAFSPSKLRFHQGALDTKAVTYRVPTEVIHEIKAVLWNMGVDMAMEGDFKIKCVRKSRKKALAASASRPSTAAQGSSSPSAGIASAALSTGPLDRRASGGIIPASPSLSLPQSPSMGFRSFFRGGSGSGGARQGSPSPLMTSSATWGTLPPSTPSTPHHVHGQQDVDPLSSPMTTSVSQFSMLSLGSPNPSQTHHALHAPPPQQPLPVYGGDKSADAGDEVRFVVELTRVKNLDRMYCVDIKRMKGGPWSYKHVYEQLLEGLELGPTV